MAAEAVAHTGPRYEPRLSAEDFETASIRSAAPSYSKLENHRDACPSSCHPLLERPNPLTLPAPIRKSLRRALLPFPPATVRELHHAGVHADAERPAATASAAVAPELEPKPEPPRPPPRPAAHTPAPQPRQRPRPARLPERLPHPHMVHDGLQPHVRARRPPSSRRRLVAAPLWKVPSGTCSTASATPPPEALGGARRRLRAVRRGSVPSRTPIWLARRQRRGRAGRGSLGRVATISCSMRTADGIGFSVSFLCSLYLLFTKPPLLFAHIHHGFFLLLARSTFPSSMYWCYVADTLVTGVAQMKDREERDRSWANFRREFENRNRRKFARYITRR